jgi:hypothetical protein
VAAFRCFLLALVAVELWERTARLNVEASQATAVLLTAVLAVLASAAALASFKASLARAATVATIVIVAIDFAGQFPGSANHAYLQLVALSLLVVLRDAVDHEIRMLGLALRWLVVAGLFWAGMQKLLYGYYFEGELLAFTISQSPRFAAVLELGMPAGEFERLSRIVIQEGAGPFRVDSLVFVVLSNVAFAAELILPVLLLFAPTRRLGVLATLAYFVAIESAAREVFFGGLMAALVLSCGPSSWIKRAQPIGYAGLLVLLATSVGLLPRWFFS